MKNVLKPLAKSLVLIPLGLTAAVSDAAIKKVLRQGMSTPIISN